MRALLLILFCWMTFPASAGNTIQVFVTVDWEGYSLEEDNIEAMQQFRKQFPHIPMLQLLNPNYFLQNHTDPQFITHTIKSTFLASDTQGLHVHAWKKLITHCGIDYQAMPSFSDHAETCSADADCGYTVSLELGYSQQDLTKLIACSNQVLVNNGFDKPKHFRAGGWQLGPKLMQALHDNDFIWDSSRIDGDLLTTRWHEKSGIVRMVSQLHPNSTPLDQPYAVSEQIMEYPNNAALTDYTNTKQIVSLFKNLITANKHVMVLGFHQETAVDFLPRLTHAIPKMEAIAKAKGWQIEWVSQ